MKTLRNKTTCTISNDTEKNGAIVKHWNMKPRQIDRVSTNSATVGPRWEYHTCPKLSEMRRAIRYGAIALLQSTRSQNLSQAQRKKEG